MISINELYENDFNEWMTRKNRAWSPPLLFDLCMQYFRWVDGQRIPTIKGLCLFLGVSPGTWARWRSDPELGEVVSFIDTAIQEEKYQLCASNEVAWKFVARDGIQDIATTTAATDDSFPVDTAVEDILKCLNGRD